jgi:alpha-galactosidase
MLAASTNAAEMKWSLRADGKEVGEGDALVGLNVDVRREPIRDRDGVVVEIIVTNTSGKDVNLTEIQPLRGESAFPAKRVLTNGYIYYDSGQLKNFGKEPIDSFWNAAFYDPQRRRVLVIGYLNNDFAEGRVCAQRKDGETFSVTARSLLHPAFVLKPGATVSSGRVMVLSSHDPFDALEFYADSIARENGVGKLSPIVNGWCSWFVYYGGVSEEEVLKNAAVVAKELKPYGMEWVQIDDGFYRAFGDWEGNGRFPHGMKHTADEIRKLGLRPGLWIAPYAISEKAPIAREHPEWLGHRADGSLQRIEPAHAGQAQLILDITHPQAREWLSDLVKTITQEWGYDFIKTDFVEWTLLAQERFHDPTIAKAQAYRLGDATMREAMGRQRHFLDCGPGNEVVGLIDSMRIGLDRPDDLPNFKLFQQYAGTPNATIPSVAKRYYFGGRTWHNDPDHLRVAKQSIPQARAAATIVALSGGTTISGDKLYELDRERLDILRKVLPSYGRPARPLDLFDNPQAELFALPIEREFENWTVLAHFNVGESPTTRRFEFARAGLQKGTTYLVYDFWAQKLLGEFQNAFETTIEPTSVSLVAIREKTGMPQVIGTDRHVMQGAIELSDVAWDVRTNTLRGVALGAAPMSYQIAIYVPDGFRFDQAESANAENLADIRYDAPVLRGRVRFDGSSRRVAWSVRFVRT